MRQQIAQKMSLMSARTVAAKELMDKNVNAWLEESKACTSNWSVKLRTTGSGLTEREAKARVCINPAVKSGDLNFKLKHAHTTSLFFGADYGATLSSDKALGVACNGAGFAVRLTKGKQSAVFCTEAVDITKTKVPSRIGNGAVYLAKTTCLLPAAVALVATGAGVFGIPGAIELGQVSFGVTKACVMWQPFL